MKGNRSKAEVRQETNRLIDETILANLRETAKLAARPLLSISDMALGALIVAAAFASVALLSP